MKKLFFISIFLCLIFLTGCSKYNEKSISKDFNKKINQITGYHIEGEMQIYNGDNIYKYNVESSYENDQYRVSLKNKANDHEQIILKNKEGVYVLTPSLNKSFKFQSNWPKNNSQVYLPQSILKDINKDKKMVMEEKNNGYILSTKVAYSNNKNLNNEKIYLDKNLNIKKVEVFDKDGNIQIRMKYTTMDPKASFSNKYFSTSENMKAANMNIDDDKNNKKEKNIKQEERNKTDDSNSNLKNNASSSEEDELDSSNQNESTTSLSDETVYPMYLPTGTYLSTEETVSKEDGERVILTFEGDSPFILVEETANVSEDTEVIPVYGEPTLLVDTVGALSDSSVNFISNGVEYYIASESLTKQQILDVASSISSIPVMK